METNKRVLVCLEGDIEVALVEALNMRESLSVARRCADLIEAEAAVIAGIGDALICQDTTELNRDFLSRCDILGVPCVVLCESQRTDDLRDMGAVLALHNIEIAQILEALEGILNPVSEPRSTWSALSPGDENLLEKEKADPQPLYVSDIFPANENDSLVDEASSGDGLSEISLMSGSEQAGRFPSRTRLHKQVDTDVNSDMSESDFLDSMCLSVAESGGASLAGSLPGKILTVRGPDGAPGRSTLALNVAIELGRRGFSTILIDADLRGASLGLISGARPEWTGLAVACRMASRGRLVASNLSQLLHKIGENSTLLTGLSRADRWREIKPPDFTALLECARELAQFVVIDTCAGLPEETNEYDQWVQREDIAALAVEKSDVVLTVGSADPVGIYRMAALLEDAPVPSDIVIINRYSQVTSGSNAQIEISQILENYDVAERSFFIPDDSVIQAAILQGRALYQMKSSDKVLRVISEIIDSFVSTPEEPYKRAGISKWLRLFRRG